MQTRSPDASDLGRLIKERRKELGATQEALADACSVSRKFIIDLESGKEGIQLGLALKVMGSLGISPAAAEPRQARERDFADEFASTLNAGDFSFALRLLGDYASASIRAGHPLLTAAPRIGDTEYLTALSAITRWVAHRTGSPIAQWALRAKPSANPVFPAEKLHPVGDRMKDLIRRETPAELADMNVWIRERDLATA